MINIVIVEDKLKNARDIAQQFKELAEERPELNIQVKAICLFYEDYKEKEEKIGAIQKIAADDLEYEIELVSLSDFDDVMDKYMKDSEEPTIAIMDFLLESATDSGARGIPTRRVNIRYARRADKYVQDRIWFYTATGAGNIEILEQLLGQDHVLKVKIEMGRLFLLLDNPSFMSALQGNAATLQTV